MNKSLQILLDATPEQQARLQALQVAFARVCNTLAPVVREGRVWNRVALHHLMYRKLRAQFPLIGSQMICNAIYSVSRTCRMVYQDPESPFNVARLGGGELPLLRFADTCPVYFDRHTLSLKGGQLSLYTLDGRMYFQLSLRPEDEAAFHACKLREIVLSRRADGKFALTFLLGEDDADTVVPDLIPPRHLPVPEYITVEEAR